MKIESFLTYNGVYLLFCLPILAAIYSIFRFVLKSKIHSAIDLLFLSGGFIYWLLYEMRTFFPSSSGKTLSNAIGEPFYIAFIVAVLFLTRSLLCKRYPSKSKFIIAVTLLALLVCILAVFFLIPSLPE